MNDLTKTVVHFFSGTGRSARLLPVFVFGWLWFVLINQLRVEWTNNPQYSYGWAVPFLCLYLAWQKCRKPAKAAPRFRFPAFPLSGFRLSLAAFVLLAFLYAPTRLIQEANPEWHLVSWALAVEVIGLTLCVLWLAKASIFPPAPNQAEASAPTPLSAFRFPAFRFSDLVFPLCFFFVAVPWPAVLEMPLIQGLTRLDARFTVELLGWIGIPAVPHGNVIEVATGEVGVSEACSGIRSFQATLMISLFLGELFSLSATRRLFCVLAGFAMSFLFNLARMSLLVWVAAKSGVAAIEKWHDPAGMTILAACFCGLWGLGEWLAKKQKVEDRSARVPRAESGVAPDSIKTQTDLGKQPDEHNSAPYPDPFPRRSGEAMRSSAPEPGNNGNFRVSKFQLSAFQISVFALAAWIVLTEAGVEAWYRSHELRHAPAPQWVVNWPTNNSAFKEMPLAEASLQILQCDANRSAGWRDNGLQWQTIFIKWNPGTLVQLGHRPSECMTAAGHTLAVIANSEWFDAAGFHLPFVVYEVTDLPRPLYIFYCMWNDRLSAEGFGKTFLNLYGNRLAPVLTGVRNAGQRSLEIAVDGAGSAEEARSAFRAELEKLVITAK